MKNLLKMASRIVKVEVKAVGRKQDWKLYKESSGFFATLTLLRITADNGLQGIA
eukprot:Pgem_evm1s14646